MNQKRSDSGLPLVLFILSACFISFLLGAAAGHYRVFPYSLLQKAGAGYEELTKMRLRKEEPTGGRKLLWFYNHVTRPPSVTDQQFPDATAGVNLVTRVSDRLNLAAELRDLHGNILHSWKVNWFDVWPDAEHIPDHVTPKSPPGTHIHGATLLQNGNLVFNYEHLGTVCLDPASRVVWKLPYRTHHSIHLHDDGNLWICAQKTHPATDPLLTERTLPYDEYMILEVSPDGVILKEWSVDEILKSNGLNTLLTAHEPRENVFVYNDILHLNDAEPFPTDMEPGIFGPGDVLVSLRNIDTVFVFNRDTQKIRYRSRPGMFRHQHDPDFIDGNTFSVFDNNVLSPFEWEPNAQSRIVAVSAIDDSVRVIFEGSPEQPFFSRIMGKHQWLANGHLIITESTEGRALEIDDQGRIVWEWLNLVGQSIVGIVEQVDRLPESVCMNLLNTVETEQ